MDEKKQNTQAKADELTHHSKREYHFPLILRRIYWWTCNICGAQYSPKDKSLTKVG